MKINHNITALNAYRNLSVNNSTTAKSLEKLSSGLRINRASDDAAGLAISEKMRSQIRGLDMAERNALDGISFIQTAEGALSSTHEILQRMRELAIQAANDSNTDVDRKAIQEEINQLTNEINRISNTTEFNTKKLLDGSLSNEITTRMAGLKAIPASNPGQVTAGGLTFDFAGAGATLNGYTIEFGTVADGTSETASIDTTNKKITINGDFDNTDGEGKYSSTGTIKAAIETAFKAEGGSFAEIKTTVGVAPSVATTGSAAISGGVDAVTTPTPVSTLEPGQVKAGGLTFDFTGAGATLNGYTIEFGTVVDGTSETASIDTTNKKITINGDFDNTDGTGSYSSSAKIKDAIEAAFEDEGGLFAEIKVTVGIAPSVAISGGIDEPEAVRGIYQFQVNPQDITIDGTTLAYDAKNEAGWKDAETLATIINENETLSKKYEASVVDGKIELMQKTNQESATAPVISNGNNLVTLQIGANQGQTVSLEVKNMQAETLGISDTIKGGEQKVTLSNGQEVTVWYTTDRLSTNGSTDTLTEFTLDVSSNEKAGAAITILDDAIQRVSAERSRMGAVQNRLEYAIDNLKYMSENVTASESRIRDLDMALEMTTYTKNNILVQSAQAMLAQANQLPQGVLQLLK